MPVYILQVWSCSGAVTTIFVFDGMGQCGDGKMNNKGKVNKAFHNNI